MSEPDFMSGMDNEETKGEKKEESTPPNNGVTSSDPLNASETTPPSFSTPPITSNTARPAPAEEGDGGYSGSSGGSGGTSGDTPRPLSHEEVEGVTSDAFKEAYDYYKHNAVGDPKTREANLEKLRNELAEYQDEEGGKKTVTRGLLKNFTDENYQNALTAGQHIVDSALIALSQATYADFDAFKVAREKAAADVHAKLQKNVAYPELSERLLKGLEDLSTKMQLQFNVDASEREKEALLSAEARKNIERQRESAEMQSSVMNVQQHDTNVEYEKRLLAEQNEKQYRDWKARVDLETKLREQQIVADLKAGYEDRANRLRTEFAQNQQQTVAMMMQMQKESLASQAKLQQVLLQKKQEPPRVVEVRPPGLLTSILTPVATFVDGVLGKLI